MSATTCGNCNESISPTDSFCLSCGEMVQTAPSRSASSASAATEVATPTPTNQATPTPAARPSNPPPPQASFAQSYPPISASPAPAYAAPPPQFSPGYPPSMRPRTNPVAVLSAVLALVATFVFYLNMVLPLESSWLGFLAAALYLPCPILSPIALGMIKRSRGSQTGREWAHVGLWVAVVHLILIAGTLLLVLLVVVIGGY